jgi:transcription antitermination factor NusG
VESNKISYPWFALQVKGNYENVVAAHLGGKDYEWFLPLYKSRNRWSDRWKEIKRPLFPGYLFCQFNPLNRVPILTIPGVTRIVGTGRNPIAIEGAEIAAIQATVKSGLPSQPWPYLRIGRRVRIEYGPLSGLDGILLEFKGEHRLVLSVSLLQRSVAVEVDGAWVTSVPEQSWAGTGQKSVSLALT